MSYGLTDRSNHTLCRQEGNSTTGFEAAYLNNYKYGAYVAKIDGGLILYHIVIADTPELLKTALTAAWDGRVGLLYDEWIIEKKKVRL